jgi:endonuclease/exonuclease/phosphatase family metal-dependent hydrolase
MVRIASFNVENLFERPKAFNLTNLDGQNPVLEAYKEVNVLIKKDVYSEDDKARIRALLVTLGVYFINGQDAVRRSEQFPPQWAWLRMNRGTFDRQPQNESQDVEITAEGRGAWIGWIELVTEPTDEIGTRMTARVIRDVNADILGIIEAEDRPSLVRFNDELLEKQFRHAMLVDGNDDRGIDVGIMTRENFEILSICSNVDSVDHIGQIFSRDCPQYEVRTPNGNIVHVLVNHFKSQSGGGGSKRERQANKVREIADNLMDHEQHVVVLGDLNEGPPNETSPHAINLAGLYNNGSRLIDCYSLAGFDIGARPGSYNSCGLSNRLDYIFISESLRDKFRGGGLFRKGLWGSRQTRPTNWETYPEMEASVHQASDHAVAFVDLDI